MSTPFPPLSLPEAPEDQSGSEVKAWSQPIDIPTFDTLPPEHYPMFLERRVYQGSCGELYPLPYIERIATEARPRTWQALHLENQYLRVMILPEIGGRIHLIRDRSTGKDLIYRQDVIKPALVGLAGPWISGGIEFNWPQHHRPATYMPVQWTAEHTGDGSAIFWLSDHDPMQRMKGMHGISLAPGSAAVQLHARLHNRTDRTQTFLWWANVATEVHEQYQSFFPPDAGYVVDHAKRATSTFPLCTGHYYGVDYATRGKQGVPAEETPRQFVPDPAHIAPNDLSWYANIPVPTSYMCIGTEADFFGGYDHRDGLGIVHVCDHTISPGKKQWTWGNHEFGYAWDRHLTEPDERGICRPYIEIMAGVYTDNQPDFSFLAPGEVRRFTQCWYPIHEIGPAVDANEHAALAVTQDGDLLNIGICVTRPLSDGKLTIKRGGDTLVSLDVTPEPGKPWKQHIELPEGESLEHLVFSITSEAPDPLLTYQWPEQTELDAQPEPEPATEPPAPQDVATIDELYLNGRHLAQYRHATRSPEPYWREGLRRDPGDSRCHAALGEWHLRRGEFEKACEHLEASVARLTRRNPNPAEGEPHYLLGQAQRYLDRPDRAYEAFGKAAWHQAWRGASWFAMAQVRASEGLWQEAVTRLRKLLKEQPTHGRAQCLLGLGLQQLGEDGAAKQVLNGWLAQDPLDVWAMHLLKGELIGDGQACLDIAWEYLDAGCYELAMDVVDAAPASADDGVEAVRPIYRAYLQFLSGDEQAAEATLDESRDGDTRFGFPSRLGELRMLEWAVTQNPQHAAAFEMLGNWLYAHRRHAEAITQWEAAAQLDPRRSVAWRNLGIAQFNTNRDADQALHAYEQARAADPESPRLLIELNQLEKLTGVAPEPRMRRFEGNAQLVSRRDDLTIEHAELLNAGEQYEAAVAALMSRHFQPWEGGEGKVLTQYKRAQLGLARQDIASGQPGRAIERLNQVLDPPHQLGEAWHLLVNLSDVWFLMGEAEAAAGRAAQARRWWERAASFKGDFVDMAVMNYSTLTLWTALAKRQLGDEQDAQALLQALLEHAQELEQTPAKIDYFATSLPTMLLFHDDLDRRQRVTALTMQAQAKAGLGDLDNAKALADQALALDRYDVPALEAMSWIESRTKQNSGVG